MRNTQRIRGANFRRSLKGSANAMCKKGGTRKMRKMRGTRGARVTRVNRKRA